MGQKLGICGEDQRLQKPGFVVKLVREGVVVVCQDTRLTLLSDHSVRQGLESLHQDE